MTFKNFCLGTGLLALSLGVQAQALPTKTYIVQLADAPVASYTGGVAGLSATKPSAGAKLNMAAAPVRSYETMLAQKRSAVLAAVGNARVVHTYSAAFNGFAVKLTEAQRKALLSQPGVVSIQEATLAKPITTHTPEFLGVSKPGGLWSQLDGKSRSVKGEDIIVGVIDSGIWPENPSFGDRVDANGKPLPYDSTAGTLAYGAPPAKWKGSCQTGPGFTTAMCNNKLLGARYYADGILAMGNTTLDPQEFLSPRNGPSDYAHGTHTAGTAVGNSNADAVINGMNVGVMSGIAPRARLAVYKVCWSATDPNNSGCNSADTVKAIDDAVKDGVDVINFSVSGSLNQFDEPVELAFYHAAAAGVFVAAGAGNSGPLNVVSHPSPWLMTVAASTHDRFTVSQVTLGNGKTYSGASYQVGGLPAKPLILAANAGPKPFASMSEFDQSLLSHCNLADSVAQAGGSPDAVLDPQKTAGRIVVCERGGSFLLDKGEAVKKAGGIGMVIVNTAANADDIVNEPYAVPTVHLPVASYNDLVAYAGTVGATASFSPRRQQANVVAPQMNQFSSRGPNLGDENLLKPEIAAPGLDIVAPWLDTTLTQAQHDALANNGFRPQANANAIAGTSMATPHVAGVGALLKQLHPTWSPAAIKSAIMTTAGTIVLPNGQPDPERFAYGAGHLNPNAAADPGLVYDASTTDFARFLCGKGITPPPDTGGCATVGAELSHNLNQASISAGAVPGSISIRRTVTNVSKASATYVASATLPGWNVTVTPSTLKLAPGASASYSVKLVAGTPTPTDWAFGNLVWTDGVHRVTSPLSALPGPFNVPPTITTRNKSGRGNKVFSVTSNYTGSLAVKNIGLLAPKVYEGTIGADQTVCFDIEAPQGNQQLSFAMFENEVSTTIKGLDLDIFIAAPGSNGLNGLIVGGFLRQTSNEQFSVNQLAAGPYQLCAISIFQPAVGTKVKVYGWTFAPGAPVLPLRSVGPSQVHQGGTASITTSWDVAPGQLYLGGVRFSDPAGKDLGKTDLLIDTR